jgi:hypothetical protein
MVTDTFGVLLPSAQIEIRRFGESNILPVKTSGHTVQDVPVGTYQVSASLSGYTTATRTVDIDRQAGWITLALALTEIEGSSTRAIRGRVSPLIEQATPIGSS